MGLSRRLGLWQAVDKGAQAKSMRTLSIALGDYPQLFQTAFGDRVVRRPEVAHAPLRIYGPLEARLSADVDDATLEALGEAAQHHRSVWIGATNADTGIFTRFDVTSIAATEPSVQARRSIVDRVLAASAIPVFLPPRFIDGCMYIDGGVRENLFLAEIGDAIRSALGGSRVAKRQCIGPACQNRS